MVVVNSCNANLPLFLMLEHYDDVRRDDCKKERERERERERNLYGVRLVVGSEELSWTRGLTRVYVLIVCKYT